MKKLELKVPPPAVALLTALLMWLVAHFAPACRFNLPARPFISASVAAMGVVTAALGFVRFRQTKTTTNPMKPESASSLVVSGIYRFTRNPMYLGLLLVLFGWAIFLSNALSFVFLPVYVFYINRFQIRPEERALDSKFGRAYTDYRSKVRPWL